nr:radical SAM protein [Clostridia bacterium]
MSTELPAKRRNINVPIFIPHLGCPNDCVFCNQRTISGHRTFDIKSAEAELDTALSTLPDNAHVEIAFFGGSFTGIDRSDMTALLDMAASRIADGKAESIRLSTRPDYIDDEILSILSSYPVRVIELGLQSLCDNVLCASKRGHTAKDAENACRLIKAAGFTLVGQMMLGLPLSTREDEITTARLICEYGCDAARIYPTAVLCGTELAEMTKRGEYTPLPLDEAVSRAADVLEVFIPNKLPVIRLGLHASDVLFDEIAAGEYHAAIGELAYSEYYMRMIRRLLDCHGDISGKALRINVPMGEVSKVIGQKRKNK